MKLSYEKSNAHAIEVKQTRKNRDLVLLNDYVCRIQGIFPQFSLFTMLQHRELKVASKTKPYSQKHCGKLLKELNEKGASYTHQACIDSKDFFINYFDGRMKSDPPRFCVKLVSGDSVEDIYRCTGENDICSYSEHSSFGQIKKTGKAFICNDIPTETQRGRYRNGRIDHEEVKKHYSPPRLRNKLLWKVLGQPEEDLKWAKYWDLGNLEKDAKSCYKSTLVVPMTLVNNRLTLEFKQEFLSGKDAERTIFGFVCLGHSKSGFFTREDVKVGYVVADLLSLFLMHMAFLTDNSKTVRRIKGDN